MATTTRQRKTTGRPTLGQLAALAVGAVFLAVGILGFIPGVTTGFDGMTFHGHHSEAKLLGLFQVSVLHNIVHLVFGVAGLAMSRAVATARWFLIGGGIIYLLLWLYGLIIDKDSGVNVIPVNRADDWLHLGLGLGMLALGLLLGPLAKRGMRKRERALHGPGEHERIDEDRTERGRMDRDRMDRDRIERERMERERTERGRTDRGDRPDRPPGG